jgi:hypothetical protein
MAMQLPQKEVPIPRHGQIRTNFFSELKINVPVHYFYIVTLHTYVVAAHMTAPWGYSLHVHSCKFTHLAHTQITFLHCLNTTL